MHYLFQRIFWMAYWCILEKSRCTVVVLQYSISTFTFARNVLIWKNRNTRSFFGRLVLRTTFPFRVCWIIARICDERYEVRSQKNVLSVLIRGQFCNAQTSVSPSESTVYKRMLIYTGGSDDRYLSRMLRNAMLTFKFHVSAEPKYLATNGHALEVD